MTTAAPAAPGVRATPAPMPDAAPGTRAGGPRGGVGGGRGGGREGRGKGRGEGPPQRGKEGVRRWGGGRGGAATGGRPQKGGEAKPGLSPPLSLEEAASLYDCFLRD